jgi:[acyl-carrier-protein] S-malonyltransferase
MARDLMEQDEASRQLLAQAEDRLEIPLRRLMLEGPEADLQATEHAQPAIVLHSLALLAHIQQSGLNPVAVAGHSLGEFSGVVAAGGLEPMDALLAVQARGRAMAAGAAAGTGMAAVLGLADGEVERICEANGAVVPANYNAPGQVVISGTNAGLEAVTKILQQAGARRVIRLSVSAAFHSPLMVEAARAFKAAWDKFSLRPLERAQVFNADAQVHATPAEVRELLVRQLTGPVRWTASVQRLAELGADTFVEIGPGKTLTALVKRIMPSAMVHNIEDLASLKTFLTHAG